jgi:hypothetical protein
MKIDGSCHCGFITYEAEVNPEKVYICHCTDCQSISGSPFRWATSIPEENFKLLSGRPKTYVKKAASGKTSHQLFCPECASPLYSTSLGEGPRFLNLRLGTARQRAELRPSIELWCGSAQEWAGAGGETKKLAAQ